MMNQVMAKIAGVLLWLYSLTVAAQKTAPPEMYPSGPEFLVTCKKDQASADHLARLAPPVQWLNLHPSDTSGDQCFLLRIPGSQVQATIDAYQKSRLIRFIEPNYYGYGAASGMIPDDPYLRQQWYLINDGSFQGTAIADADIDMDLAWELSRGSSEITVAILDTGIKPDHPEFANRLWTNPNEIAGNGLDDDHNGYIDDLNGWDFVNNDRTPVDDHGHGTLVSAILGANGNNARGYAGMDWNCKLMVCKVLDQTLKGYYSDWIAGIYYAVDNGADVINLSLGGKDYSHSLEEAVEYAHQRNVVVVASMQNQNTAEVYYPAGYEATIAVGATDPDDSRSTSFLGGNGGSNYGQHLDVVAPGNYIYGPGHVSNTDYNILSAGTSLSTPMVSGLAALLRAQKPERTANDIEHIIFATAEDETGDPWEDTPGWDPYYGYGRINAYEALSQDLQSPEKSPELSVFPNPASGYLTISFQQQKATPSCVKLYSLEGHLTETLFSGGLLRKYEETFPIAHLPAGIYLLFIDNGHQHLVRKIMIEP